MPSWSCPPLFPRVRRDRVSECDIDWASTWSEWHQIRTSHHDVTNPSFFVLRRCPLSQTNRVISLLFRLRNTGDSILRRADRPAHDGHGADARADHEEEGRRSYALRQDRQDGLFHSAFRALLLLSDLRRGVWLGGAEQRRVFRLRGGRLDRGGPVPRWANAPGVEPGLVRTELSRRHRYGATGQADHHRHLRVQPQSHLCRVRTDPARAVPHLLELVAVGLSRRGLLALSPPGPARGGVPEQALRLRLRGVLQTGKAVPVSPSMVRLW